MIQKISDGVYGVGVADWNVRSFHGYTTPRGATYNAYLLIDEKSALIDTCKAPFANELIDNVKRLLPSDKLDYIICNHAEPDHSGALPKAAAEFANAEIIACAPMGAKNLKLHYGEMNIREIKSGESLNIGKRTLEFIATPMVHWPDNMVTYDRYDRILFSNDAFGEHYACSDLFDYKNDVCAVLKEAKKYYANIVLPYSAQAAKALSAVKTLQIDAICPSHGVVWKKHLDEILRLYEDWTGGKKTRRAVVAYSTMWHNTELMARAVADGFKENDFEVKLFDLDCTHPSDIMTELMDAEYLAAGSSTLNNNLIPSAAAFLTYAKGLAPKGLKGFAFGSYGWSGQSVAQTEEALKALGTQIALPMQKIQFTPTPDALESLKNAVSAAVKD